MTVAFVAGAVTAFGVLASSAFADNSISQKGREFHPGEITIKRGETIQIVNDDGDLLHHAYIEFCQILVRLRRPEAGFYHTHHLRRGR